MGSILNIDGHYFDYDHSKSGSAADYRAMQSDWQAVGNDIRKAMQGFDLTDDQKTFSK